MIPKDIMEKLSRYSVPELCDGAGLYSTMDYRIRQFVGTEKIIGEAITIDVPVGDGGFIPEAIEQIQPGQVVVIAGKGNCRSSYWGDHRSLCAKMMGAVAVVIDGAFRDIDGCEETGLPIFARGVTPGTAVKAGNGALNVPVCCGDAVVNPGDIIVGDRNGVCVIRPDQVERVLERAKTKVEAQERTIAEMKRAGKVITKIKVNY